MTDTITLPRSVVQAALDALEHESRMKVRVITLHSSIRDLDAAIDAVRKS